MKTTQEPVPRVGKLSREEFLETYLRRNRPVVLTDVLRHWPAFEKWTPEYLKQVGGETEVTVHYNDQASFFDWYVHHEKRVDVKLPFRDFVDRLLSEEDAREYYMTEYRVRTIAEALLDDLDFSDYFDADKEPYEPMLFLGRDTMMPLHYHGKMEAFLCQLQGEKRVTLYAPKDYSNLYPGKWHKRYPLFSRIDGRRILAGDVDVQRFPRFPRAEPIVIDLHPGDMLYIPLHWWHLTCAAGYQVNVSHFFRARLPQWNFPVPGFPMLAREAMLKASSLFGTPASSDYD